MVELKGVNHLAMVTRDMDATVRFYTGVLGMKLVRAQRNDDDPDSRHYFFDMGGGNLMAFFDFQGRNPGEKMHHIAMTVESVAELERTREELIRKGIDVSSIVDHDFIKSIYFRDPNGILLEISAYTRRLADVDVLADPEPVPALRELLEAKV